MAANGESDVQDNRPTESLVPDPTAQPGIEQEENATKLKGAGARQPCGRVVGIIRRHWREKQYCGSLRQEGDRAVTSGKGQTTSALFMPVDRKASWLHSAVLKTHPQFILILRSMCFTTL